MAAARSIFVSLMIVVVCFAAASGSTLRGTLTERNGSPSLDTADRGSISLTGDEPTRKVLADKRISGMVLELKGHFTKSSAFTIDPIETHSMVAIKEGKRYRVTYFCDVCAIRSFTPGLCVCCQQETRLDLIDPS